MVSPVTAFRFTPAELAQLDALGTDFLCNRTDVLRYAMAALRDNADLRSEIAAYSRARTFLQNLRTQYGENAVLELTDGIDDGWTLNGQPVDTNVLTPVVKPQGGRWVLHLLEGDGQGVGIKNVMSWEDEEAVRHAVVPLRDLWVHSKFGAIGEPKTSMLRDGRPVVRIEEDNGSVRHLAVGDDGSTTEIEVPEPVTEPSVGIGVRRESTGPFGPHLGAGFGGKLMLTGDLERDRSDVIEALNRLLTRAENGDLDDLLAVDVPTTKITLGG